MEDDEVSQDIQIKKYILRHKGLIVIPRILRKAIFNSKTKDGADKTSNGGNGDRNIALMLKEQWQAL